MKMSIKNKRKDNNLSSVLCVKKNFVLRHGIYNELVRNNIKAIENI